MVVVSCGCRLRGYRSSNMCEKLMLFGEMTALNFEALCRSG